MPGDTFELDEGIGTGRRSPQESGQATWAVGNVLPTSFDPGDPSGGIPFMKVLARVDQGAPEIFALHLDLRQGSSDATSNFQILCGMLPDFELALASGVAVIIEYGDLTGRHKLVADFRSGVYQLPACSFVQVSGLYWSTAGVVAVPLTAAATLSRAPALNDARFFTLSGVAAIAAGGSATARYGNRAVAIDLWSIDANPFATQPVLRAENRGLLRDYLTPQFIPPWGPVLLGTSDNSVRIFNDGAAITSCLLQFILQP